MKRKSSPLVIIGALSVLLLFSCTPPQPTKAWTKQMGSPADDFAYAVALDEQGNAYIAGSSSGNFDGLRGAGYRDLILGKYDAGGRKLWSTQMGTSSWEEAYSIAVGQKGDVYTVGYTYGGLDGNMNLGQYDFFLVKHDAGGNKLWSKQMGTEKNDYAYSVAVDKDGNAYVAGYTYGSFEGSTNAGSADIFLIKYDTNGNMLWVRQMGTASDDIAYGVAVDKDGNAYVAGYTGGGFDGNAHMGSWDIFLIKYDSNGTKLWSKQAGTPSWDEAWAVAVDKDGNAYVAGYTGGGLDGLKSSGAFDLFLIKYGSNGNKLWVKQTGTAENDYAHAVAVDANGNAYVSGYTEGGLGGVNRGDADPFVVSFSPKGRKLWTYQTGTSSGDYAFGVAVDSSMNVYAVGETSGTIEENGSQGAYDLCLFKLNAPKEEGFFSRIKSFFKGLLKKIGIG
ncbi:MAG: SBBP repeat-containing protein [Nitrospirae bacterium]|nr:SBBP repeat-containing protein [Nitrospirota bacterium]